MITLIEKLKKNEINAGVNILAKSQYISSMQLQRNFYNITGYSPNEYSRRLRLLKALCFIKNSGRTLADIAYACGYSSQQALCREIKTILNTTATDYKKSHNYYFIPDPVYNIPFQIEVGQVKIPKTVHLRYYDSELSGIERRAVHRFLNNPNYNGRIWGRNGTQAQNIYSYELFPEEACSDNLNLEGFEFVGHAAAYNALFAQTRVNNTEDMITKAWNYLYAIWLPNSTFGYAAQEEDRFQNRYFEEYYCIKTFPQKLKLYLPIIRRQNLLNITIKIIPSMYFICSSAQGVHAEKESSSIVIDYLSKKHSHILQNSNEFYYQHIGETYTCGVRIPANMQLQKNPHMIAYRNQAFAVLQLHGIGDYEHFKKILFCWLLEQKQIPSGEPFIIYDTAQSFDEPKMHLYYPIQNC